MTCLRCGQPPLPHTRLCWACGAELPPPEAQARLEVLEVDAPSRPKVAAVLANLVGEPPEAVLAVVGQPPFQLGGATPEQADQLAGWLATLGVRLRAPERPAHGPGWRFGLRVNVALVLKLLVIGGVGYQAQAQGLPALAWAALATAALTLLRATALAPTALSLDPTRAQAQLALLDPALTQELLRSRRALSDPEVLAGVGRCLAEFVDVMFLLRADGAHLERSETQATDRRLQQLLREALRIAGEAQRSAWADASAAVPPEKLELARKFRADLLRQLDHLTEGLTRAKVQTLGLSKREARAALDKSIGSLSSVLVRLKSELDPAGLTA